MNIQYFPVTQVSTPVTQSITDTKLDDALQRAMLAPADESGAEEEYDPRKIMMEVMLKDWKSKILAGETDIEDNW